MSIAIRNDVELAPYTTLKTGGQAKYFVAVKSNDQLVEACRWASERLQKVFVLGGGSNTLISDAGFNGLVVLIDIKGQTYQQDYSSNTVFADIGAGEVWDDFVSESINRGYFGLECLSGIPGKVGASAVGNIGAYGQEVCQVINKVRFYDVEAGEFGQYSVQECQFNYRESIFKSEPHKVVVSVQFKLGNGGEPCLKYKELAEKFVNQKPTIDKIREAVLDLRRSKSMVIDSADPNSVSAGSFFKNPAVPWQVFEEIVKSQPDVPNWPQKDKTVKLSAGWLIEKSGLPKGYVYKEGKVGLSQKHALAIINRDGASANDVLDFSRFIQQKVSASFSVKLEPEVVFVGFD